MNLIQMWEYILGLEVRIKNLETLTGKQKSEIITLKGRCTKLSKGK